MFVGTWKLFQGRELCSAVLDHGLTPLNDSVPTFLAATGRSDGNLDLFFLTSSRVGVASAWVTEDTLGSDHFLVLGDLGVSPRYARSTSNRFNTKNVDWIRFRELVDDGLRGIDMAPDGCSDPVVSYSKFFYLTTRTLERCGAYHPSSLPGKRKSQPLWWNSECEAAILIRREALRMYTTSQTREGRATCRRVDEEVKSFLRR